MQSTEIPSPAGASEKRTVPRHGGDLLWPLSLVTAGLALRVFNAAYRFLNADEALHYLLSVQSSVAAAYRASLTTAHPPWLIIWLYLWGKLGHSELFLRLPCVVAGTLFCWVMYCWLRCVANDSAAIIGLGLFLFSPPLIQLSAEVRQYAFLLLFCALSLYFLERALAESSPAMAMLAALFLYLALLTHYSALIFALTLGVYALLRFVSAPPRVIVLAAWAGGQILALAIVAFMYVQHISKLESSGDAASIADSYLSRSVLHPGQNPLWFIARSNLRLFHYCFSQGAIGVAGLLIFAVGLLLLLRTRTATLAVPKSPRTLLLLLVFPLVVNCALGLLHVYPYGGTRHDAYLMIFVFCGIAIAMAVWKPNRPVLKGVLLALVLTACNLFPAPTDQYLRLRDQNRKLMQQAVHALNSLPSGSIIFTDDQGGLLLSYYLCGNKTVQIEPPFRQFFIAPCRSHEVLSIDPRQWIFKSETLPDTLLDVQRTYDIARGARVWFFQSGWFIDKEQALRIELAQYGCSAAQEFGRNMFLCPITLGGRGNGDSGAL